MREFYAGISLTLFLGACVLISNQHYLFFGFVSRDRTPALYFGALILLGVLQVIAAHVVMKALHVAMPQIVILEAMLVVGIAAAILLKLAANIHGLLAIGIYFLPQIWVALVIMRIRSSRFNAV
ncbi:MAG TPA: hypothetical protein VHD85_21215 [Terracidiphilus sp.]|nr:hypothetical protein [Terracidiphilus sp.]